MMPQYRLSKGALTNVEEYINETGSGFHTINRVTLDIDTPHDMLMVCMTAEYFGMSILDLMEEI